MAARRGIGAARVEYMLLCARDTSEVSFHIGEMLTLTRDMWGTFVNSEGWEGSAKLNSSEACTQISLDYTPGPQVFPTTVLTSITDLSSLSI